MQCSLLFEHSPQGNKCKFRRDIKNKIKLKKTVWHLQFISPSPTFWDVWRTIATFSKKVTEVSPLVCWSDQSSNMTFYSSFSCSLIQYFSHCSPRKMWILLCLQGFLAEDEVCMENSWPRVVKQHKPWRCNQQLPFMPGY